MRCSVHVLKPPLPTCSVSSTLARFFLIRSKSDPSPQLVFWLCVSALSMVFATAIAGRPGRQLDLWLVREWLDHWRTQGNPYLAFDNLDYPPSALLVLWPLGLLSDSVAAVMLSPLIVAAAGVAVLLLVRWFSTRLGVTLRWQEQAALMAMVLAGSSVRGALWRGQTAPLAFLFGALALHWSRRRPALAAVALALCAFKPHVAAGFALAILLTKRIDVVLYAVCLVGAQTAAFAMAVGERVPALLLRYAQILATVYEGDDRVPGLLSIRWVIEVFITNYETATLSYVTLAAGALAVIALAAVRRRDPVTLVQVTAACLLWSLVFLPHQVYNNVLSVPAIWLLMWPESRLLSNHRARLAVVVGLITFRVIDPPRLMRLTASAGGPAALEAASYFLRPLIGVALLALLLWSLVQRADPPVQTAD